MGRQSSVSTKGSTATSAGGCSSSSWKADSYDVAQGSILSVSTCAGTPLLLQSAERHFRRYVLKVNGLEEAVNKVMALCQTETPCHSERRDVRKRRNATSRGNLVVG